MIVLQVGNLFAKVKIKEAMKPEFTAKFGKKVVTFRNDNGNYVIVKPDDWVGKEVTVEV